MYVGSGGINEYWMKNVLTDIDILKLVSRIEDSAENVINWFELYTQTNYYKEECVASGVQPITLPRYHVTANNLEVGGSLHSEFKAAITSFCRLMRCLINDVMFAGIIDTNPKLRPMDEVLVTYVNVHTSCLNLEKSLRETMKYMVKATTGLITPTTTGYQIDSPDIRGMVAGILQVMLGQIAIAAGINGNTYCMNDFFCDKKADRISSKTLSGVTTHVVEAFIALYSAPVDEESDVDDSSPLVVAEHLISVLAGIKLSEVKNFSRRLIEISGARHKMKKAIRKIQQDGDIGGATGRSTTTGKFAQMTRSEKSKLAHPGLAPITIQKLMKKQAKSTVKSTPVKSGLGRVYLIVDCSGSTLYGGGRIKTSQLFENIALSIGDACAETDQDFTCLFYGNSVFNIVEIPAKAKAEEKRSLRRQLAGNAGSFENDEQEAFNVALDYIDRQQKLQGKEPVTLLFLTDGMILTSGRSSGMTAAMALQLDLEKHKAEMDLKILPIVVYDSIDEKFCTAFRGDQFVHVEDATAFSVAHLQDIMAYVADVPHEKRRDNTIQEVSEKPE